MHWIYQVLFLLSIICSPVLSCREGNKAVGVCLHVYLERDFLSLENIVYPSTKTNRRSNLKRYNSHGTLKKGFRDNSNSRSDSDDFKKSPPDAFIVDSYGDRDWIEGPELADHCRRLREVITCFETVLVDCDSGHDFFRYRHLLYALSKTHTFLCETPDYMKERFLKFLKTIECAERARLEVSCKRHNVSENVWNQILRGEIGEEICHSLSTQRACLLEHGYIDRYCRDSSRIEIYENVSHYFLSIWCHLPLNPKFISASSASHLRENFNILFIVLIIQKIILYYENEST